MKILYPQGEASEEETEEILKFAMEGRKRVKDQLMRIDSTFSDVQFAYTDTSSQSKMVATLEEEEYPQFYGKVAREGEDDELLFSDGGGGVREPDESTNGSTVTQVAREQHLTFQENQRGISFESLLGVYLEGAHKIKITDPYIRLFYQVRNLMEFIETVVTHKPSDEEVSVHLVTTADEFKGDQQLENLEKIKESCLSIGINFTWEFDRTGTIHARNIVTDNGWKIILDRGLDIFQHYEMNDAFAFANRLQQYRPCKAFEVTFVKTP